MIKKIFCNSGVLMLLFVLVLNACSSKQKTQENHALVYLTDSLKKIVTLDTVGQQMIVDELKLNGEVTVDQNKIATISPILGGTVMEVKPTIGDYVQKGEVLAVIKSSEVADYQKQLVAANQHVLVAQRNLEAMQDKYKSGMASEIDILQAKQDLQNAQAEQHSIEETFSLYNMKNSYYQIKSPISGFVVDCKITKSMQIRSDQSDKIFTICGLDDIWVMADVYESDINKIVQGDSVLIKTLTYNDKTFKGKINKIYNILDENSRTMSIRIQLQNQGYLLKPGMFTSVTVKCGSSKEIKPYVSPQSIIFNNGKNYVVAVVGDSSKLEIREVAIFKQLPTIIYISSGLNPGDMIIDKNALLVYNALKDQQ